MARDLAIFTFNNPIAESHLDVKPPSFEENNKVRRDDNLPSNEDNF